MIHFWSVFFSGLGKMLGVGVIYGLEGLGYRVHGKFYLVKFELKV